MSWDMSHSGHLGLPHHSYVDRLYSSFINQVYSHARDMQRVQHNDIKKETILYKTIKQVISNDFRPNRWERLMCEMSIDLAVKTSYHRPSTMRYM